MTTTPPAIHPRATLSPDGVYRYTLTRTWGNVFGPHVAFGMLNPSAADAERNDPTVTRCVGFASAWGFAGLHVFNLFAFRATDPKALWAARRAGVDVVGPHNDYAIREVLARSARVVLAWGSVNVPDRAAAVLRLVRAAGRVPHCLAVTRSGAPGHPLYLKGSLTPVPYKTAVRVA